MEEIWKDVVGYEGLYQVSNTGKVRSLNYRAVKNRVHELTPKTNNSGRLWVELFKDGIARQHLIHRIVGNAFIPNPYKFEEINHKDENPKNNNVNNLEWCTREYNVRYYNERHPIGNRNGKLKKLAINQISGDGTIIRQWNNAREVFVQTGMSASSITDCCRGKRKTAYGFKWQYAI